jgi:peroxiredoxin
MSALQAGTRAPDFSLHTTPDQSVGLHEFRGRRLILAFYPADWSPVCHLAFAKDRKIHYPLLSDFEPKGEVSRAYGVYHKSGVSERALFVLDEEGTIRWSYVSPIGVNPGADGILNALEAMGGGQRS